jgi:hypothetical protein
MSDPLRHKLNLIAERLSKVVYFEPHAEKGGRNLDGLAVLLEDSRWLATQLAGALDLIDKLKTPKESA